jgi:hypothetical protein
LKMILETNNQDILTSIKNIFKKETSTDFWDSLSQSQKDEIQNSLEEIKNGDIVSYEEVLKKHR